MPALKKEGILIYSTCSYSKSEDEDIIDWISTELRIQTLKLKIENGWSITEIETGLGTIGYRFWPDKTKGEGFFIACFKKREGEEEVEVKVKNKAEMITKKEVEVIRKWVKVKGHQLIKKGNTVYAWPGRIMNDMNFLLSGLKVVCAGVRVGELMRDKLIPDHALAMSGLVADSTAGIDLNYEQAIRYLQRKDLKIDTEQKGWQLVNFEGHPTGWINVLPNRINNYYPKALRILKDVQSPPL
jgi:NOL1/NOP2/fmu family ribosome biogenesis protein